MEKFDVVVIGAGPGGYPAAIRAAQLGASVAIVEKERVGGACLNWGCIPTKLLLAGSDAYERMRHADAFGLRAEKVSFDYAAMIERKNRLVEKLRAGVGVLLKSNRVTVITGRAAFLSRNRLVVEDGGAATEIEAGRIIIATGAVSAVPGFLPHHPRVVESRAFLDCAELPASVIVLGGGVIGCEFACLLAQLGVPTTVVEILEDILAPLDADVRREVRKKMEGDLKIRVLTGKPLEKISATDRGVRGMFGEEAVEAELLLVSVGRLPFTDGLNLKAAGLTATQAGHIPTDEYCQTRAATIYAIGDVTEGPQLAHRATSQGITVAENAWGKIRSKAETVIPSCLFTSPEIGCAGLTEQEAKVKNLAVKVGKFPFSALGKALATGQTGGFVKWIADAGTGRLLGAHAVGAHATDLIAEAALAIRSEQTAEELARTVHAHPTFSEAWMEAAHLVRGHCIHLPARGRERA